MSPPKTLTDDQCQALIEQLLDNHSTAKQQIKANRNASIAITMLETGVRVAELCGLRIDDLWFAGLPVETLIVRKEIAKNKKERQVPISGKLAETIRFLHEVFWLPKSATSNHYAFFASSPGTRLTTRTVERIILAAGRKALNVTVTPHMLRHTFGSRLMRKANARVVQALLGHSSLQSTQIYMHPNSEDLNQAING
jgi:integrase/recombinase XerC